MKTAGIIACSPGEMAKVYKTQEINCAKIKEIIGADHARAHYRRFIDDTDIVIITKENTEQEKNNRAIYNEDGSVNSVIRGPFVICRIRNSKVEPLTAEQTACYAQLFKKPQHFYHKNGKIIAIDYTPQK